MTTRVLVTGSSGGIGSALVAALAPECEVIGWDIVDPVGDKPQPTSFTKLDQRDEEAVAAAATNLGDLDAVVLLAGRALEAEIDYELRGALPAPGTFASSVALNLTGHYNVMFHVDRAIRTGGSITYVSTINAIQGFGLPAYSSAKAGLHGLVTATAAHFGARSIRVNGIALGTVATAASALEWKAKPERLEHLADESCLRSVATPEEAASVISDVALRMDRVTGQVIVADGGQTNFRSLR